MDHCSLWYWGCHGRMQSVPITTNVASSNCAHGEVHSIQHYAAGRRFSQPIKLVLKHHNLNYCSTCINSQAYRKTIVHVQDFQHLKETGIHFFSILLSIKCCCIKSMGHFQIQFVCRILMIFEKNISSEWKQYSIIVVVVCLKRKRLCIHLIKIIIQLNSSLFIHSYSYSVQTDPAKNVWTRAYLIPERNRTVRRQEFCLFICFFA